MFLSAILLAASLWPGQEPRAWCTVTAAGDGVSPATVRRIESEVESGLAELQPVFRGFPNQPFALVIHRTAASLPAEVANGEHRKAPGLALLGRQQIHLVLENVRQTPRGDSRPVVVHELVHILLHQYAAPFGDRLPRWFHEGLAQTLAGDTYLGAQEEDIIWRVGTGQLLNFAALEHDFPPSETRLRLAYAQSYSYVAWLHREFGIDQLLAAVRKVDDHTSLLAGLVQVTRKPTIDLENEWRDYLVHHSGARFRVLLENCFSLSMIFVLPLVALALIRRLSADRRARQQLERFERLEQLELGEAAALPPLAADSDTGSDPDADAGDAPSWWQDDQPAPAPRVEEAAEDQGPDPDADSDRPHGAPQ